MALSQPRGIFGIHSISPYRLSDKSFYGTLRVLASSSVALSGELIDLLGGSNRYPWASEVGQMTAEMALSFREYPNFIYEVFAGAPATTITASATTTIQGLANYKGVSMFDAANGISAVAPSAGALELNCKFGQYVGIAKTVDTFDLYVSTNIDFARGVDGDYLDDLLLVVADIDCSVAGPVDVPQYGLTFTVTGTANFTVGDTFGFDVLTPRTGGMEAVIGGAQDNFPNFGAIIVAQKQGSGQLFQIDAFNCKASGLPIGFSEFEWSTAETNVKMLYDSARNGVFSIRSLD